MSKKKASVDKDVAKKPHPGSENLTPFTPLTAKKAAEASARARSIRKQVRAQMLDTLVNKLNFGDEMCKAIQRNDLDRINLLQTALRIVGLHHDQSEDAVQKMQVQTDNKTEFAGSIEFVLPQK